MSTAAFFIAITLSDIAEAIRGKKLEIKDIKDALRFFFFVIVDIIILIKI